MCDLKVRYCFHFPKRSGCIDCDKKVQKVVWYSTGERTQCLVELINNGFMKGTHSSAISPSSASSVTSTFLLKLNVDKWGGYFDM